MVKTYKVANLDIEDGRVDGVIADVKKTCKKVEPDMSVKFD